MGAGSAGGATTERDERDAVSASIFIVYTIDYEEFINFLKEFREGEGAGSGEGLQHRMFERDG